MPELDYINCLKYRTTAAGSYYCILLCFWFLIVIKVNSGINKVHRD